MKKKAESTVANQRQYDEYHVNDDLFPKQDEEEDHTSLTSVHVKDSSGDGDYYVNDDLFLTSTAAQVTHAHVIRY